MRGSSSLIWLFFIAIIIVGASNLYYSDQNPFAPTKDTATEEAADDTTTTGADEEPTDTADTTVEVKVTTPVKTDTSVSNTVVKYTSSGFSPETLTVEKGTTVTFINDGGGTMWVATDEHPSHTGYAGTSKSEHCPDTKGTAFDQCAGGSTFSFTFNEVGTWDYHNHMNARDHGTIKVTK